MTDRPLGTPQGAPASSDDPTRDVRLPRSAPTASDDPTRDVRLPPLSEHPAAWVAPAQDVPARFPAPDVTTVPEPHTEQSAPFAESLRQQTRPFGAPGDLGPAEFGPRSASRPETQPPPAAAVPEAQTRSGGRPWTWVLLAVLPVVVIVVAGVLLFLLLGGR